MTGASPFGGYGAMAGSAEESDVLDGKGSAFGVGNDVVVFRLGGIPLPGEQRLAVSRVSRVLEQGGGIVGIGEPKFVIARLPRTLLAMLPNGLGRAIPAALFAVFSRTTGHRQFYEEWVEFVFARLRAPGEAAFF